MIKNTILVCILILAGKIFAQTGYDGKGDIDYTAQQYLDTTLGSWKLKVNTRLNEEHRLMTTKAEGILRTELQAIEKRLPAEALPYLKEMTIWLEFSTPNMAPIQYHVSAKWLAMHYYDTRKESAIEIVITDYANMPHDSLPLLRLFCYAYQHRVIGMENQDVDQAYKNAKEGKNYSSSDPVKQIFPFKDRTDYFVSISTAYFGDVAYPPYNRGKLKEMDPKGYELVEKMWKVKG